jgi:hypothetical protein
MMDKVQKCSNSEYYTTSSELFRVRIVTALHIIAFTLYLTPIFFAGFNFMPT